MSSGSTATVEVDPQSLTLENMKSSLYCVRCNRILRDAVEVSCCHALYCATCIHPLGLPYDPAVMDVLTCFNCCRQIVEAPTPNFPVRRLVGTIPVPCTNEGCSEIVAAGAMQEHVLKQCDFSKVGCKYFSRGCAATMLRKENTDHEKNYCIFRDVRCPQGCGEEMQWRECTDHFLHTCSRTLVPCQVQCGAMVERCNLFQHMNECPQKPLACPYRSLGCTVRHLMRRPELEEHMAMSIHSHLLLLDGKLREFQHIVQRNVISELRPPSHDWDPGHVRCVGRWDAQHSNIYAMTVVDGCIVTGCETGILMVFHPFTGAVLSSTPTGDQPIRSLLGLGDGRVAVGRKFSSVLLFGERCRTLLASATLHPKDMSRSIGVVALAYGKLRKEVHLDDRPQFLHAELYAVPACVEDLRIGVFEVIFAATEWHVRVLDAATLEEVEHIEGHHGAVTSCLVERDRFLITGSTDGSVRVHDMTVKHFPQIYWLQCFGGPEGVRSLCIHPASPYWRSGGPVETAPCDDVDGCVVLCIGGGDGSLGFWDFKKNLSCDLTVERAHRGAVVSLTPVDGTLVASGGADEYWRAWTGKVETSHCDLPGSMYCAFARDNMLFAAGSQGCVRLWTSGTLRYNERRAAAQKKQIPL